MTSHREKIEADWLEFAKGHIYAFRCVDSDIFDLYAPGYIKDLLERAQLKTINHPETGELLACLLYEPDEDAFTVHWSWTARTHRNRGLQKTLWEEAGIKRDSNVFITHLTAVSEKMLIKYGWLFSPFSLYEKEITR